MASAVLGLIFENRIGVYWKRVFVSLVLTAADGRRNAPSDVAGLLGEELKLVHGDILAHPAAPQAGGRRLTS